MLYKYCILVFGDPHNTVPLISVRHKPSDNALLSRALGLDMSEKEISLTKKYHSNTIEWS